MKNEGNRQMCEYVILILTSGSLRGMDNDKMEMRRPKMDFPLPATLKGLASVKNDFPTMSEFFESRRKASGLQIN